MDQIVGLQKSFLDVWSIIRLTLDGFGNAHKKELDCVSKRWPVLHLQEQSIMKKNELLQEGNTGFYGWLMNHADVPCL